MFMEILGSLLLIIYGVRLLQFLWMSVRLYLLPRFGVKRDLTVYGSWAVVTGGTDGIGKAIAKELAQRQLNIVLISRCADKLKATAEELLSFNVKVNTVAYDFDDINNYGKLEKALQDLDIGILVNNVGMFYDHAEYFDDLSVEHCDKMINVNVASVHKMTRVVLGGMVRRRRGLIVNVSSGVGERAFPLATLYSASKAFVTCFSKAMQHEYSSSGIHTQALAPFIVSTKMSRRKANGTTVPSAGSYAQSAVNAFGLTSAMTGWWWHELQTCFYLWQPDGLFERFILKSLGSNRDRALESKRRQENH